MIVKNRDADFTRVTGQLLYSTSTRHVHHEILLRLLCNMNIFFPPFFLLCHRGMLSKKLLKKFVYEHQSRNEPPENFPSELVE